MEKKSTVGKFKSKSNSVMNSRIDRDNKKSSSNNEIKPHSIKKRGVYVEKTLKPAIYRVLQKPSKRPEQKKFLASVLSILSKSTAGTQIPEKDNSDRLKPRSRLKTEADKHKPRKTKYKSRVLNNNQEEEEIIVLKSKKNILSHSSSTFSNKSKEEPNKKSIKFILENNIYSGVAEGAAKDVLKPPRNIRKLRIQEKPPSEIETDKKIYNFFVDLLESTFNVCNVKEGDYCETIHSKTSFEVDESVVQKLIIKNEPLSADQKSYFTNEMDTEKNLFLNSFKEKLLDIKISDHKPAKVKPKIVNSYSHTKKQKQLKFKSFDVPRITHPRKPKQKLLDILKEQLTIDAFSLEEPKNVYQALKIIAKNKKKCEKTIHYKENKFEGFDKKECMFRRKVLFKSNKKNRKLDSKTTKLKSISFEINNDYNYPSYHSLEVYGYDYKKPVKRIIEKPVKKHNIWFAVHSPSSISESDVYCSTVELHLNTPSSINNR